MAVDAGSARSWLELFRAGDRATLHTFYEDHFDAVERAVAVILTGFDQETVVHDVFLRILTDASVRARFDGSSPRAWVATLARNAAIDAWRREHRRLPEDARVDELAAAEAEGQRAEASAELGLLAERFRARLSPQWQAVFDVRFVEGLDQREAAARLGIARTTLAYRELRVRALLRRHVLGEDR